MRLKYITIWLSMSILGCKAQDIKIGAEKNISLKKASPFLFGAAIDPYLLVKDSIYLNVVKNEFNSITAANYMKMNRLHPEKDSFKWDPADQIVKFAEQNNMRVHGHTLVWHRVIPPWVENFKGDSSAWASMLKENILAIVGHYKNRVKSWDVVNEAFEDDGSYRNSIWYQHLGEDYIRLAFEFAHEADPNALLFYNDYWLEKGGQKLASILNMIKKLNRTKKIIDGIGSQMHTSVYLKNTDIITMLKSLALTGLQVHISELTISVKGQRNIGFVPSVQDIKEQMQKYADIIKYYLAIVPQKQQYGITTWNVGDKDSYQRKDCNCNASPQIFDTAYQKKDYYYLIIDQLKNSQKN